MYIAEIPPARYLNRIYIAYAFNAAFHKVPHGWRYGWPRWNSFYPSRYPSILVYPERPRQLQFHRRKDKCISVIRRIYPKATKHQVLQIVAQIEYGVWKLNTQRGSFNPQGYLQPVNSTIKSKSCHRSLATQELCSFSTLLHYSKSCVLTIPSLSVLSLRG